MKKSYLIIVALLCTSFAAFAQVKLEELNRGLVGIKVDQGVFLSWRIKGEEWHGVTYNLYRDNIKVNDTPLGVSNYTDVNGSTNNQYSVAAVVNGIEQVKSEEITPWDNQYKEIALDVPPSGQTPSGETYTYSAGDCSVADINGDGNYEIIVKWGPSNSKDNSQGGYTGNVFLDAYTLEGEKLWRIDLGINIRAGEHYTQFMFYDLDGDGIPELACKTAPGTKDASGNFISKGPAGSANHNSDYRNSAGYILSGPEYLTLFNGQTGEELTTVNYNPGRGNVGDWGDEYGNRVDRFLACIAYLNGKTPSLVMSRGYYAKTVIAAWDWDGNVLMQRWVFDSTSSENAGYGGQGNHNLSVADVDGDGKDEIIFGSMTINNDGTGLYNTKLGHGDAMHVGDLDPFRKGLEAFRCLEHSPDHGTVYHDAKTGDILIHHQTSGDCGRCCAANVSDDIKGKGMWGGGKHFSASTLEEHDFVGWMPENFRIYWDGDLLEEMLDKNWDGSKGVGTIRKYNHGEIFRADGAYSSNWTKGTPNIQADLFGDWREEVIWKTLDNKLRIYTTTDPTIYRNYTLMHDRMYRLAIAWQNVAYNQPPHVSYFLGEGEGITVPPPPIISNGRYIYNGDGTWDTSSANWLFNDSELTFEDGIHAHLNNLESGDIDITLSETVSPSVLSINSIDNIRLNATEGKLSGEMKLTKQGRGEFFLTGNHDYSGITEIWDGCWLLEGTLEQSALWMNLFAEASVNGLLNKGAVMRYGSVLYIGGKSTTGITTITDSLYIQEDATLEFDLYGVNDERNDKLVVNGHLTVVEDLTIRINPNIEDGKEHLEAGIYELGVINDGIGFTAEQIKIEGITGTPNSLEITEEGKLLLTIKEMRSASSVVWGGLVDNVWDLSTSINFLNNGTPDVFVTNDNVLFTNEGLYKTVSLKEAVSPTEVEFNATEDYIIQGTGFITGEASINQKGSGKTTITTKNNFTGKVLIEQGTLEVESLPNNVEGNSPLGLVSNTPSLLELNGGTLRITGTTDSDRAVLSGENGGTIENTATVKWNSLLTGGSITKQGAGELVMGAANTISELVIKSGTVRLLKEEALPGKKVTFEGGALQCYDNGGTYSSANYPMHVAEGFSGTIYLDGRCSYNNVLTGEGTFNVYTPWIRSDFNGNWSAFSGNLNIKGDGHWRINNGYGYANAAVNLGSNVYGEHLSGGTVKVGSLSGSGTLGNATWELGARNEDFVFRGTFTSGSIKKVGTGTMYLMGASTNAGVTNVYGGSLIATNLSGSATGTGNIYVRDGGTIGGAGTVTGNVLVQSGGTLLAGYPTRIGSSFNVKAVSLYDGSIFYVKTNGGSNSCDKIKVTNTFTANGQLEIENRSTTEYSEGRSYTIISSPVIYGTFDSISPETPGEGLAWDLSEFTSTGKIKVVAVTGISEHLAEAMVLYPNPADKIAYISLPEVAGDVYVQLETLDGKVVSQMNFESGGQIQLNLEDYSRGIYLVRIQINDEIAIKKLMLK